MSNTTSSTTNSGAGTGMEHDLQTLRGVELFLFHEAELADANQYEDWLALWTEDLLYWVPSNDDDLDPQRKISIIYDTRSQLEDRMYRLGTKHAYAQRPKSRLTRLISNVVLEDFDPNTGGQVNSRFVVVELRNQVQFVWSGRMQHTLVREGEGWKINEKHVFLLNNDTPMANMTFII